MMKNSFKELENAQMRLFAQQKEERVFNKVEGSVNTLRFLGNIVEMYVPVLGNTLMSLVGDPKKVEENSEEQEDISLKKLERGGKRTDSKKPPSGPDFTGEDSNIR